MPENSEEHVFALIAKAYEEYAQNVEIATVIELVSKENQEIQETKRDISYPLDFAWKNS